MTNTINTNALKTWEERCLHLAPRSFVIWYDNIHHQPIKTHGLVDLGHSDLQFRSWKGMCTLLHPDHQKTIELLTRGFNSQLNRAEKLPLHAYLGEALMPFWSSGSYLSLACSVKKTKDQYWSAHAVVEPFQFDHNNKISAFFVCVQITGEYLGTPLAGTFFSQKVTRNQEQIIQLNNILARLTLKILEGMRFSARHHQHILLLLDSQDSLNIAKVLGIEARTVEGHRIAILQKATAYFEAAAFRTAQDFISYLQLISTPFKVLEQRAQTKAARSRRIRMPN
jgi:hypothetical protein